MAAGIPPTPVYSHAGRGQFRDVYEPAEDSFLLIDALEKDAERLRTLSPCVCLEVGSGSGVVSAFLASVIGPSALFLCTDVNPAAAECTAKTASCNSVSLQPVITSLVDSLLPRLSGKVDVLLFNPPYVVTPSEEVGQLITGVNLEFIEEDIERSCMVISGWKQGYRSSLGWWKARPRGHRQIPAFGI
ncbi:methyltransferase N6AMT1 [Xyrichtys novacula]|uniref:Methyltransferase HEMK2 n=1 Tax=Xyrichtys novacula TaxID=13765 RepID=A0AAV1HLQ4_XYRNO|nr:methyltransferase N6AMT1 [Xyrichtys novacula]